MNRNACIAPTNTEEILIVNCDSAQYKDINNTCINRNFKTQTQPQGVAPIKEVKVGVQYDTICST